MTQQKVYLDDQGNPIKPAAPAAAPAKVYLDDDGNPIGATPAPSAPSPVAPARDPWKKPTNRAEFDQMLTRFYAISDLTDEGVPRDEWRSRLLTTMGA